MATQIDQDIERGHYFKLTALSPLHVGTDSSKKWLKDSDYEVSDGSLKRYNTEKIFEKLGFDKLKSTNISYLTKIGELLRVNKLDSPDFYLEEYHLPNFFGKPQEVFTNIRDGFDRPYLPGSSLKGALHAVLLASTSNRDLGKIGNSTLRYLRVTDVALEPKRVIQPVKILSLRKPKNTWLPGWKDNRIGSQPDLKPSAFATFYEAFAPGAAGVGRLTLLPHLFQWAKGKWPTDSPPPSHDVLVKDPYQTLTAIINQNTRQYLDAEVAYFKYFEQQADADHFSALIQFIEDAKALLPAENDTTKCVFFVGRNIGFHRITGNWQFPDDHVTKTMEILGNNPGSRDSKKTRKFAVNYTNEQWKFQLFGMVQLEWIPQVEAEKLREEVATAHLLATTTQASPTPEAPVQPEIRSTPEPKAFEGTLKKDVIVFAKSLRQEGDRVVLEAWIASGNQEVRLRYPAGIPKDEWVRLKVTQVNKRGTIETVQLAALRL